MPLAIYKQRIQDEFAVWAAEMSGGDWSTALVVSHSSTIDIMFEGNVPPPL